MRTTDEDQRLAYLRKMTNAIRKTVADDPKAGSVACSLVRAELLTDNEDEMMALLRLVAEVVARGDYLDDDAPYIH
jgi:hypothetical protein